jgi:hypothetical protein
LLGPEHVPHSSRSNPETEIRHWRFSHDLAPWLKFLVRYFSDLMLINPLAPVTVCSSTQLIISI